MKKITFADFQKKFQEFVKQAKEGECFIVTTKRGKPLVVLMNPLLYELLELRHIELKQKQKEK